MYPGIFRRLRGLAVFPNLPLCISDFTCVLSIHLQLLNGVQHSGPVAIGSQTRDNTSAISKVSALHLCATAGLQDGQAH